MAVSCLLTSYGRDGRCHEGSADETVGKDSNWNEWTNSAGGESDREAGSDEACASLVQTGMPFKGRRGGLSGGLNSRESCPWKPGQIRWLTGKKGPEKEETSRQKHKQLGKHIHKQCLSFQGGGACDTQKLRGTEVLDWL